MKFVLVLMALSLGLVGCNEYRPPSLSGVESNLEPGALTPESMTQAGVPLSTQSKIIAGVAKVQSAARTICGFLPLAEGVANIFIAQNTTSANVQGVANLTCKALVGAPSYSSLGGGSLVKGSVLVNGKEVNVWGRRLP